MNTRIKELAEQCWDKRPEGQLHFDNEKFAELIIKECADLFTRTHTDEQYQRRIDKTIRKHFGVEE
jgi:hypothetical protein